MNDIVRKTSNTTEINKLEIIEGKKRCTMTKRSQLYRLRVA